MRCNQWHIDDCDWIKVVEKVIEYGIFNLLPEGQTIEDISEDLQWLYLHPFQTGYDKQFLEATAARINKQRGKTFNNGDPYYAVSTYCEVRERTITYSEWRL